MDQVKFLGMVLDEKLTRNTHIQLIKQRSNKALNILKKLSTTNWGADRKSMIRIYQSHIRSILDYGSPVYISATKKQLNKLNPIQNQAIRLCTGAFKTSPTNSLHIETAILPLKERRDLLALKYYTKIAANNKHPNYYKTFHSPLEQLYSTYTPFGNICRKKTLMYEIDEAEIRKLNKITDKNLRDKITKLIIQTIKEKINLKNQEKWNPSHK